jgi:transcriptional regulator with XRE-family HTH domain
MFQSKKLKQCRKQFKIKGSKKHLSVEKLAVLLKEKTGLETTRQSVDNWERGRNEPTTDALFCISEFFGKPVEYFFARETHRTGAVV